MPSIHDMLAADAVGMLVEHFGERSASGALANLTYWPPDKRDGEGVGLPGIASPVRSAQEYSESGVVRKETKTWLIERRRLDAVGVMHPQRRALARDGDGDWSIDVDNCVWDANLVTLALVREPRTAGNELRRAV